jgi:hypothetical protein
LISTPKKALLFFGASSILKRKKRKLLKQLIHRKQPQKSFAKAG